DPPSDAHRASRLPLPARLPEREHLPAEHPRDRPAVPHQEHEDGVRPPAVARREGLHRARPVALARRAPRRLQGDGRHAAGALLRPDPRGRARPPPRAPGGAHHDGPPLRAERADVLLQDPGRQHDRPRDQRRRLRDGRPHARRRSGCGDRRAAGRRGDGQGPHPPRRHHGPRPRQPERARDRGRPGRRLRGARRGLGDLPPALRRTRPGAHRRDGRSRGGRGGGGERRGTV
ncbi:MAG: hypothetical protein AVDCRST_MAG40-2620, partial [uncultured Gemmatimonadaceae bacterium]